MAKKETRSLYITGIPLQEAIRMRDTINKIMNIMSFEEGIQAILSPFGGVEVVFIDDDYYIVNEEFFDETVNFNKVINPMQGLTRPLIHNMLEGDIINEKAD